MPLNTRRHSSSRYRRDRRGVTLPEFLLAIAVVSFLLASMVNVTKAVRETRAEEQTQQTLRTLSRALRAYSDHYQTFPKGTTPEVIQTLQADQVAGPLLENVKVQRNAEGQLQIRDGFGHPVEYADDLERPDFKSPRYMPPMTDEAFITEPPHDLLAPLGPGGSLAPRPARDRDLLEDEFRGPKSTRPVKPNDPQNSGAVKNTSHTDTADEAVTNDNVSTTPGAFDVSAGRIDPVEVQDDVADHGNVDVYVNGNDEPDVDAALDDVAVDAFTDGRSPDADQTEPVQESHAAPAAESVPGGA